MGVHPAGVAPGNGLHPAMVLEQHRERPDAGADECRQHEQREEQKAEKVAEKPGNVGPKGEDLDEVPADHDQGPKEPDGQDDQRRP